MPKYFNPSPEEIEFSKNIFDDMLEFYGKPCKLIYQGREQPCPNCIIDPRTRESTNLYKTGGPIPFPKGQHCPVCDGKGRLVGTGSSDLIKMTIEWNPKPWMNIGLTSGGGNEGDRLVRLPAGIVLSRGYIKDLPKILKADYCVLDITNPFSDNKFKLNGEPWVLGAFVKNRYFGAVWERSA
jgi:hypothetical protein